MIRLAAMCALAALLASVTSTAEGLDPMATPTEIAGIDRTAKALGGAELLNRMNAVEGAWRIDGEAVLQEDAAVVRGRAYIQGALWTDMIVRARITISQTSDDPWSGLRIMLRAHQDSETFYTVGFNVPAREVRIEKSTGLVFSDLKENSSLIAAAPHNLRVGETYDIAVVADRATIYCFINGAFVGLGQDSDFMSLPYGGVGFYAARASGRFEAVSVAPLRSTAHSPVSYHPANPLNIDAYSPTVIKDGGHYKMWFTLDGKGQAYAASKDGIQWERPAGEGAVIPLGAPGEWGDVGSADACAVKLGDEYWITYPAVSSAHGNWWDGMGLQRSRDGVHWEPYEKNPYFYMGPMGAWDEAVVGDHCWIKDGDTFKMWFVGITSGQRGFRNEFGYAESNDGIHWRKHPGNPVLTMGQPGEWDGGWIYAAGVVKLGDPERQTRVYEGGPGSYHLFYTGQPSNNEMIAGVKCLGYAFSLDGIHWVKYNDPDTNDPPYHKSDPVLSWTQFGEWAFDGVRACTAVLDGDEVKIYFSGSGGQCRGTGLAVAKVADLLAIVEAARDAGRL